MCQCASTALHLHPFQNFHAAASLASLSARRCRFSNKLALRALKIACCLFSTPIIQYPKLAPAPAKTGYAHKDSLLKNGRISRPSCQMRTARPRNLLATTLIFHDCYKMDLVQIAMTYRNPPRTGPCGPL